MELTALQYGKTYLRENWIRTDGDASKEYPISLLFFVIRAQGRIILVDVGCDTMPGFFLEEHESPVRTLESFGIDRTAVTDVIITHAHHDHIDGLRYYPGATAYLHEKEREEAAPYLLPGQRLVTFTEKLALLPGLRICPIGGHTPGSSVVELDTDKGLHVLCGDECYHRDCFGFPEHSGGSTNREKTLAFFAKYSTGCETILFHDPTLVGHLGSRRLI